MALAMIAGQPEFVGLRTSGNDAAEFLLLAGCFVCGCLSQGCHLAIEDTPALNSLRRYYVYYGSKTVIGGIAAYSACATALYYGPTVSKPFLIVFALVFGYVGQQTLTFLYGKFTGGGGGSVK